MTMNRLVFVSLAILACSSCTGRTMGIHDPSVEIAKIQAQAQVEAEKVRADAQAKMLKALADALGGKPAESPTPTPTPNGGAR